MGRLLVTLATLLILLLSAAFVAPAFVDWKSYRPDIEQAASALLGRKISIIGDIDIALLPEPHLHAKKVVAEGGRSDAAQMTADAVDLTLSLQALLSGGIEASKLKLVNPFVIIDLSKPLQSGSAPTKAGPLAIAAEVTSLEIEGGRISVYPDAGQPGALILTGVDGTLSSPHQRGNAYRFAGRASQDNQRFDVKFTASPNNRGVKLAGSATELRSKAVIQADGVLNTADAPVFEGSVAAMAPQTLIGAPFDIQAKAAAKLDRAGLALADLTLTLDPGNRPQVLTGSASVAFTPATADVTLQAHSLDADSLAIGAATGGLSPATAEWDKLRAGGEQLLWLYPDFGVHLTLAIDQMQLRGDAVEGAKADATRTGGKWLFEDALATLPGENAIRLTGALKKTADGTELLTRVSLAGKNLGRLSRWMAPAPPSGPAAPAKVFTAGGLLTLSDSVAAFTDVKGDIDGAAFTASLRADKAPVQKLKLSLAGDTFDLTGVAGPDAWASESVKAAWQAALAQLTPFLGGDPANFRTADVDISAARLRSSLIEAKNVAIQLKLDDDLLTVTKLSAETADGLSLQGEGAVPMRSGGLGRFGGRIEAGSAQAVLKAAALAGWNASDVVGNRAENLAPAALSVNYSTDAESGTATAHLSGYLGASRLDGRVQMKGSLAEWRAGRFSGQATLSAADGAKLAAFFSPMAPPHLAAGSTAPGSLTVRLSGPPERLDASVTLKTPPLQAQLDGVADFKNDFTFSGKAQASSQTPEQVLPPPLLALLGGERQSSLKVETNVAFTPGHFDASRLKAESPKNVVTGHLAIGLSDPVTEVDADLKAGELSLPPILGYLLAPPHLDRMTLALPTAFAAPPSGIWSDRPFLLRLFRDTAAKITLAAKTMRVGETFALSDAHLTAKLDDGRFEVQRLDGKALGGDLAASLSLDGRGTVVAAAAQISLAKADLSAIANSGSSPIMAGRGSLTLQASGQGLSPRGVLSVLQGRGVITLVDGQLAKFSPARVQKIGDELASVQQPLPEETIKKKVLEALQSADLKYRHLKIPLRIRNGMLEMPRASFRNKEGTVRTEVYLDLSSMQADTVWQAGVSSDRRVKWPPVKVQISGQPGELGAKPRVLLAEDFARAILVRKMEGDITRLENLNKPQAGAPPLSTKPEPVPGAPRRKRDQPEAQTGAPSRGAGDFEKRMRDALSKSTLHPDAQ